MLEKIVANRELGFREAILARFRMIAPEYANMDNAEVLGYIEIALGVANLYIDYFGEEKAKQGGALYTGHLIFEAQSNKSRGGLTAKKVGDFSESYGSLKERNRFLLQYKELYGIAKDKDELHLPSMRTKFFS